MNTGGICIGCTMPGFPDRFAPFYQAPPGSSLSTTASRLTGTFIRALRGLTQQFQNRSTRWEGDVPSGWGHVDKPNIARRTLHEIYEKMQFISSPKPQSSKHKEQL
jgi:hydrogenase small subunit